MRTYIFICTKEMPKDKPYINETDCQQRVGTGQKEMVKEKEIVVIWGEQNYSEYTLFK